MAPKAVWLLLLGLLADVQAQDINFGEAAKSIDAFLASPTFIPHVRPKDRVEEWISLGDSYTAGTGANGADERVGADAIRGLRSYAAQTVRDRGAWKSLNGADFEPRFTWTAFTGDTTKELVEQQLNDGEYHDLLWERQARNIPFGHPQIGVMSIGGNDAQLSRILNDCIYRGWLPKDCQQTIREVQESVDNGSLFDRILYGLFKVAEKGRERGGAVPSEAFQLYVLPYIEFFNEDNPECDSIDWQIWGRWGKPSPLTTDLRKQLNALTRAVNEVIKQATDRLAPMGVICVEGINEAYNGHRYCEPGHTFEEMTDAETWFWTQYSNTETDSEDEKFPQGDMEKRLLDFVFPGENRSPDEFSEERPPWNEPGAAERFPSFEALLQAAGADAATTGTPFYLMRSFHPKGTAYKEHSRLLFAAIFNNRDSVPEEGEPSNPNPVDNFKFKEKCRDWIIPEETSYIVATCKDQDGNDKRTQQDMNLCLGYEYPDKLIHQNEGRFKEVCQHCFFNQDSGLYTDDLFCACHDPNMDPDPIANSASVAIGGLMQVLDNGHMMCLGHISASTEF